MAARLRHLALSAAALLLTGLLVPTSAAAGSVAGLNVPDSTSAPEAARVDAVPTPVLDWWACTGGATCATTELPVDYDDPTGPTTTVAMLKVAATDPAHRIGTLFLNPGGPGGSGVMLALAAPYFLSTTVRQRFDLVGFDPRGTNFSDNIKCFTTAKDRFDAADGADGYALPQTTAQQNLTIAYAQRIGPACAADGLAAHMSTAEVARDMDVLRRAVGDSQLSYLGFSYGTALGQYYAAMFPDRVRAVAVDGVINPVNWVGDAGTPTELDSRLHSGVAAYKALRRALEVCRLAGKLRCPLATQGDPWTQWRYVAAKLRAHPLVLNSPAGAVTVTYGAFVTAALGELYGATAYEDVVLLTYLMDVMVRYPRQRRSAPLVDTLRQKLRSAPLGGGGNIPNDNSADWFYGVTCTDAAHPANATDWPTLMATANANAPYFGEVWGWQNAPCATGTWTAQDADAYRGPFNKVTEVPVLFVGDAWDPATSYNSALSAAAASGGWLIRSNSWGHTAYGTSRCVTQGVDYYLLYRARPSATVCQGDNRPSWGSSGRSRGRTERAPTRLDAMKPASVSAVAKQPTGEPSMLPPIAVPALRQLR